MGELAAAASLAASVDELYVETIQRLEGALQAVCSDFRAEQYAKACFLLLLSLFVFFWIDGCVYRGLSETPCETLVALDRRLFSVVACFNPT